MRHPTTYIDPAQPAGFSEVLGALLRCVTSDSVNTPETITASIPAGSPLRSALERHGLLSTLAVAVNDGWVKIHQSERAVLDSHLEASNRRRDALLGAAERIADSLADAGIETRVLKGLATATLDHRKPELRDTSDVDLLVRPHDFEPATAHLLASGWQQAPSDLPAEILVERTFTDPSGIELDLHRRLYRFDDGHTDLLFGGHEALGPASLVALSREGRLVHAATNLLLEPPGHRQATSLLDVAVIAEDADLDRDELRRLGSRLGVSDIVAFARWLARSISGSTVDRPPAAERTLINAAHLRTDRRIDLETLAILRGLPSAAARRRYISYQLARRRTLFSRRH